MANIYTKGILIGGVAGCLDAIDGAVLYDQDRGFVITGSYEYSYVLDADSGLAENSPYIIKPDVNAGTKRWVLVEGINTAVNTAAIATNITNIALNTAAIADNVIDIDANAVDIASNLASIGTNTSNISTNISDIADNVSAIADNVTDIATNANDIDVNEAGIATNVSGISGNASGIAANVIDISNNTTNIAANTGNVSSNTVNIATNTFNINTNTGNITSNTNAINANTANITGNTSAIGINTGNITNNTSAINLNTANIAGNVVDIAANAANILINTNDISGIGVSITNNANAIAANTVNITSNTNAIASNVSNISLNTTNISNNVSAISGNTSGVAGNVVNIATNVANININAVDIADNVIDIASNTAALASFGADIIVNTGNIVINAGNISTNTGNITTNTGNINAHTGLINTNTGNIATNTGNITTNIAAIASNSGLITTNAAGISNNAADIDVNDLFRLTPSTAITAGNNIAWTGNTLDVTFSSSVYVSVKDYGAVGDGVVDDTTAIQNTINAIGGSTYGGTVFFPSGNYKVSSTLTLIKSGVTLRGESLGSTKIVDSVATGNTIEIGVPSGSVPANVAVTELSVHTSVTKTSGACIYVYNSHATALYTIGFGINVYISVQFEGGINQYMYYLRDFEINGGTYGIVFGTVARPIDIWISNGAIANCTAAGIYMESCDGVYMDSFDMISCYEGFLVAPGAGQSTNNVFCANVLSDSCDYNGFNFNPTGGTIAGWMISNCWSATNGSHGVYMAGTGLMKYFLFSNCYFVNNDYTGVYVNLPVGRINFSNCHCNGNSLVGVNTWSGMLFGASVTDFCIIGGNCNAEFVPGYKLQKYGIELSSGCNAFVISGVNVTGNNIGGINDASTQTSRVIENCPGYVTSNKGSSSIAIGTKEKIIPHYISTTPDKTDVILSMMGSTEYAGVNALWVDSINATNIVIKTDINATQILYFAWHVKTKDFGSLNI